MSNAVRGMTGQGGREFVIFEQSLPFCKLVSLPPPPLFFFFFLLNGVSREFWRKRWKGGGGGGGGGVHASVDAYLVQIDIFQCCQVPRDVQLARRNDTRLWFLAVEEQTAWSTRTEKLIYFVQGRLLAHKIFQKSRVVIASDFETLLDFPCNPPVSFIHGGVLFPLPLDNESGMPASRRADGGKTS